MENFNLNFQDTKIAFADKSDAELKRKFRLFSLMSHKRLVTIGQQLAALALRLNLPIRKLIKATIFQQFCGGETIEECQPVIDTLGKSHIGTILDYSIEGKSEDAIFDRTKNEIYRTVTRAREDESVPFAVFKVTGLAKIEILEKLGAGKELFVGEQVEWERAKARIEEICGYAHSIQQPIFIDAEESWFQPPIDALAAEMMEKYNREKPIIFNTIQLYRRDRLEFLKSSYAQAQEKGYILAVKLVRGAYMEKERARAEELNYSSPIQPDKQATDRDFNLALQYCVENVDSIAFVAGTHNEESVKILARLMSEKNIPVNHQNVYFSQLYGMSDNLSYVLGKNNYNVSKYVPYGPVRDALPYLIRRAEENTSVMGQMSRELELLGREIERREKSRQSGENLAQSEKQTDRKV